MLKADRVNAAIALSSAIIADTLDQMLTGIGVEHLDWTTTGLLSKHLPPEDRAAAQPRL